MRISRNQKTKHRRLVGPAVAACPPSAVTKERPQVVCYGPCLTDTAVAYIVLRSKIVLQVLLRSRNQPLGGCKLRSGTPSKFPPFPPQALPPMVFLQQSHICVRAIRAFIRNVHPTGSYEARNGSTQKPAFWAFWRHDPRPLPPTPTPKNRGGCARLRCL